MCIIIAYTHSWYRIEPSRLKAIIFDLFQNLLHTSNVLKIYYYLINAWKICYERIHKFFSIFLKHFHQFNCRYLKDDQLFISSLKNVAAYPHHKDQDENNSYYTIKARKKGIFPGLKVPKIW